jgi:uncharacterized lipoprotein YmbA
MSRQHGRPAAFLVCCALLGCGTSPPERYYTLKVIAPTATATQSVINHSAVPDEVVIRLEPVSIPPELDRPELVSRDGAYRVRLAELDRWAAPLEEQIRRTLSDDLAARLAAGLVADPTEPAGNAPRRLLSIAIVEFDVDESCATLLRAAWSLRVPKGDSQSGTERVQMPGSGPCSGGAVPAALSGALATLADRLAVSIVSDLGGNTQRPLR